MIRTRMFIFLFLLITTINFSQTTYYVSSSQGNDANSGTSETAPWKTILKVNSISFNPGDQILFNRGDIWVGEQLFINRSGTANGRIKYATYGTGLKPIITTKIELPGWNVNSNWTLFSNNIWRMDFTCNSSIDRLWIDGVEAKLASCYNLQNWYMENLKAGDNGDGTIGVNSTHQFFFDRSPNNKFYLYSTSNPATNYKSIEIPGKVDNAVITYETVSLRDADYVTLDGLDVQGGIYSSIGLSGSDYVTVTNCNIGKNSNWAGISADAGFVTDKTSDYVTISNDTIDSYWDYDYIFYTQRTPYGLRIGGGASNWDVHDNFIKDWWFDLMVGSWLGTGLSEGHNIHNNEMTNPNMSFAKFMQIESSYPGWNTSTNFYNNYMHDSPTGIQVMSANNKFYFNIFENINIGTNSHLGNPKQSNSGWAFQFLTNSECQGGYGTAVNNNIFNNTFYNLNTNACSYWGTHAFVYNNLFANCNLVGDQHQAVFVSQYGHAVWKNNLFYYPSFNTSNPLIYLRNVNSYTVTGFNALNGQYEITISGNLQHTGSSLDLINLKTFDLPSGSLALDTGFNIEALVPVGFTDKFGNVINRTIPDIGAVQSNPLTGDTSSPTLLAATLLDSTKLLLTFSEPLRISEINTLSNYSVTNGIIIYSAELNANPAKITLTTSSHNYNQNYSISVYNLQDLSGSVISSTNNSISYLSTFDRPSVGYVNKLSIIKAIASNTSDANTAPEKTIDGLYFTNGGDPNSRWAASPTPQWLIYDLGVTKQISKTRISFYEYQNGRIYNYNISVSNDSVNWVNIIQNATSSNQEWTVNIFNPVIARFVKLELISNNQSTWATVWETEIWGTSSLQPPIEVKSKIFLQGAYENNQMRTNLLGSTLIPLSQPYNFAPWYHNGFESVSSVPSEVVDWILLELRNDLSSSTTVAKRAAFVKNDGTIVDLDGISPINFYGISNGDYYVIIRHRNHLSIMSEGKVTLTESSSLYDFTVSPSRSYGNDLTNLGDGKYGMYSGDSDANGIVNVLDYGTVGSKLFQTGYLSGDLDLNGTVNVLDYGKTNQNLFKVSNVP